MIDYEFSNSSNFRVIEEYEEYIPKPTSNIDEQIKPDDSILLIRLSAVGCVTRVLPIVFFLRRNGFEGKLGWVVHPPHDDLVQCWDEVDKTHTVPREALPFRPDRYINSVTPIQDEEYDWVFDLHGLIKSGLVTAFSDAKNRVGFNKHNSKEFNHWFQNYTISALPAPMPRILKFVQLLRTFMDNSEFTRPTITPGPPTFERVNKTVNEAGNTEPVLVHPGTSNDRYGSKKEWGHANYTQLIERMLKTFDRQILITWGPGEEEQANDLAQSFNSQVETAPKTPSLKDLTYLIHNAKLLICGDTGPGHMADALGTPLVSIFGSSNHRVSAPLFTNYRLLTCRANESETKDIPVGRVWRATRDLLETID